jgi:hypothetical protein
MLRELWLDDGSEPASGGMTSRSGVENISLPDNGPVNGSGACEYLNLQDKTIGNSKRVVLLNVSDGWDRESWY